MVIEQAKGVISERASINLAEAFTRLRCYARNGNLRLTDVAEAAVGGTLDPLAWAPPAVRPSPDGLSAPGRQVTAGGYLLAIEDSNGWRAASLGSSTGTTCS